MKLQRKNTKGFTLIELLVVITIIGILSVGGMGIYTAQIEKARDTTRITSINALKTGMEMLYQDESKYPKTSTADNDALYIEMLKVLEQLPVDPKHGETCNSTPSSTGTDTSSLKSYCAYAYKVGENKNGIDQAAYELSTAFENGGNMDNKAASDKDNGEDELRFETGTKKFGKDAADIDTKVRAAVSTDKGIVPFGTGVVIFAGVDTEVKDT